MRQLNPLIYNVICPKVPISAKYYKMLSQSNYFDTNILTVPKFAVTLGKVVSRNFHYSEQAWCQGSCTLVQVALRVKRIASYEIFYGYGK